MSPIRRPFQDAKAAACPSKSLERDWPKRFPHPRSRSGPHHNDHDDSAGMRPKLDERTESEVRHQDYLDTLPVPNLETVEDIAKTQEEKEKEIDGKYGGSAGRADGMAEDKERKKAASTIQRNYRGYKTRRELSGLGLDPSTRWTEAIKQAQYRNITTPHKRASLERPDSSGGDSQAKQNWKRITNITRHAHGEPPELKTTSSSESDHDTLPGKLAHKHRKHVQEKQKEIWKGKMMDLPYFLEMVDLKHRYGSSLRSYHAEWKKSNTHENFFYWLDHGEGKNVEIPACSRERLEREQVRYLSREERMQYLVIVDKEGRLCWHKNGQRMDTSEEYRDSVEGIVKVSDPAKVYREDELKALESVEKRKRQDSGHKGPENSRSDSTDSASASSLSSEGSKRYPDPPNFQEAKGPSKLKTVSPHLILNRLMRTTVKKNTWIFAADTSMNLYVGIKQSGAFQHSSFLHGSRISAAGLIKIKHGQLRSLSPLSGHYRPPAQAFRHFVHHLRDQGVDMSRVSISKAYAVLVGLETYMSSKQKVHEAGHKVKVSFERMVAPERAKEREESEKDPSQSARLEEQKLREAEQQRGTGLDRVLRDVKGLVARGDVAGEGEGPQGQIQGAKRGGNANALAAKEMEESRAPEEAAAAAQTSEDPGGENAKTHTLPDRTSGPAQNYPAQATGSG